MTYIPGTPYIGANAPEKKGPGGHGGEFIAWDATTGKKVWGIEEPFPVWGGALATAGDVVFYGTLDGWFKAVDATHGQGAVEVQGRLRRRRQSRSRTWGRMASSTSPCTRASAATWASSSPAMWPSNLPYDVRERGSTLPDLARWTSWGGMLFVFSL